MNKLGLSIAIAAALGLGGCGGSSGGGGSSSGASATAVSGTASKGIVSGALVSAFIFNEQGVLGTDPIATTETNASGGYTLSIPPTYAGKPIFIVVDDNNGTATMKCDIAPFCDNNGNGTQDADDAAFGNDLALADGALSMSAVLADQATPTVNVTPLTTVAAKLVEKAVQASPVITDAVIKKQTNDANSQVADRLGLSGDVTKFEVVDLTNPESVTASASNADVIKYAALNAAIVSSVQSNNADTSLNEAIEKFANDYRDNGLTDNAATDTVTDLGDLLTDVSNVITAVKDDVLANAEGDFTEAAGNLDTVDSKVVTDKDTAQATTPTDTGTQGTPSETGNDANLVKVKAFAEELRELGVSIDSKVVGTGDGTNNTIGALADNFELELDAADLATSDDVDQALEALTDSIEAMAEVYASNFNDSGALDSTVEGSTIGALPGSASFNGIAVNVASVNGIVTLTVDQSIGLDQADQSAVDFTATVDKYSVVENITKDDVESTDSEGSTVRDFVGTIAADIALTLKGTVTNGNIKLTAKDTSKASIKGSAQFSEKDVQKQDTGGGGYPGGSFTDNNSFKLDALNLNLDTTIEQTTESIDQNNGAISFDGSLTLSLGSSTLDWEGTEVWSGYDPSKDSIETEKGMQDLALGALDLRISGSFANDRDSVAATLTLKGDTKGATFSEIIDVETNSSQWIVTDNSVGFTETEDKWVGIEASLTFSSKLNGVTDDAVKFTFDAKRTAYDDATASVMLQYPGRTIDVEAIVKDIDTDNSWNGELTLTNNDGVKISVSYDEGGETQADKVLDGEITLNGTKYADLILDKTSVERIVYSDGTFESLF